jgi:MoaA/NifB/PqqE/SkfB family radical SAM enzyme
MFNLKNISFIEAWENSFNGETLSSKQDIACGNCYHKSYCQWCPGIAYLEAGNAKARVPYLCSVMEAMSKK